MKILLATTNRGKAIEIRQALSDLPLTLMPLSDLPHPIPKVEETAKTFLDNAVLKARHYQFHSKLPVIADDSGIEVEALRGELGIHTRRWGAGPQASDEEWISYFLDRMKKEKNKRARFVCVIAYMDAEGVLSTFEGECRGVITENLEAEYLPGLPISSCFRPNSHSAVFSALNIEKKNSTSHRGRAVLQLRNFLARL